MSDWMALETHLQTVKYGVGLLRAVTAGARSLDPFEVDALGWLGERMNEAQRELWKAVEADLAERREAQRANGARP